MKITIFDADGNELVDFEAQNARIDYSPILEPKAKFMADNINAEVKKIMGVSFTVPIDGNALSVYLEKFFLRLDRQYQQRQWLAAIWRSGVN